ncbi:hypothetical protein C0J52_18881 [Blattella germanica]|nr:hypothetical protein C0J52_18881 [Blattella germanica]
MRRRVMVVPWGSMCKSGPNDVKSVDKIIAVMYRIRLYIVPEQDELEDGNSSGWWDTVRGEGGQVTVTHRAKVKVKPDPNISAAERNRARKKNRTNKKKVNDCCQKPSFLPIRPCLLHALVSSGLPSTSIVVCPLFYFPQVSVR